MSERLHGSMASPRSSTRYTWGPPDRILEMAQGGKSVPEKIQAQSFGALWLANLVEKEINLAGLIDEVVGEKKEKDKNAVCGRIFFICRLQSHDPGLFKTSNAGMV